VANDNENNDTKTDGGNTVEVPTKTFGGREVVVVVTPGEGPQKPGEIIEVRPKTGGKET